MKAAFAIPAFRKLFIALAATMVADSVLLLTFGISVKELTGSSGAAGLSLFCVAAPSIIAPLLGWLVDQFPRRTFLLVGYPLAVVSLVPLVFVHDASRVWLIYTVAFSYGLALVMLPAAVTGLLKLIVPAQTLAYANAATSTFRQGLRLFGPLAGAAMYGLWGLGSVVVLAGCAYVVAIVAVLSLRVNGDVVEPPELRWRQEFVGGITHVVRDKLLWYPLIAIASCIFTFGFIEPLAYSITDAFDKPATFVGVIVSVQGVGAVAGGLLSARLIARIGHVHAIVLALALFATGLGIMAIAPTIALLLIGALPLGFGLPVLIVSINTLLQIRTPNRLMGRVSTTTDAIIGIPQVIAIATGSALVVLVDYRVLLAAMAAAMAVIAVSLTAWRRSVDADSQIQAAYEHLSTDPTDVAAYEFRNPDMAPSQDDTRQDGAAGRLG